jgi:hypothetical protein
MPRSGAVGGPRLQPWGTRIRPSHSRPPPLKEVGHPTNAFDDAPASRMVRDLAEVFCYTDDVRIGNSCTRAPGAAAMSTLQERIMFAPRRGAGACLDTPFNIRRSTAAGPRVLSRPRRAGFRSCHGGGEGFPAIWVRERILAPAIAPGVARSRMVIQGTGPGTPRPVAPGGTQLRREERQP